MINRFINRQNMLFGFFYGTIVLGFLLHTSAHPAVLNKYTIKYSVFLVILILLSYPLYRGAQFILCSSAMHGKGKKARVITPRLKIAIVVGIAFFFLFLPLEILLRYKFRNFESTSYRYTINNFHPFLQSKLSSHENLNVNEFGFRAEPIKLIKPRNTFRIFVLGGSTVLNREVIYEKNAVRLLELSLKDAYPKKHIEVINAGKDYYTSEHSLIQYMFYIREFQPDMIIMWHGINDLLESCSQYDRKYKPDYSHNFGILTKVITDYFRPQPIISVKLVSLDFFLRFIRDNFYSDITVYLKNLQKQRDAISYLAKENTVEVRDFPSISAYKRNLKYFIDLTRLYGVKLILANQPSLYKENLTIREVKEIEPIKYLCMQGQKYYSLDSFRYAINLFNQATREVAQDSHIPFVDLEAAVPKDLNHFVDAVHYTEQGNERIAKALFNFITEQKFIQRSDP